MLEPDSRVPEELELLQRLGLAVRPEQAASAHSADSAERQDEFCLCRTLICPWCRRQRGLPGSGFASLCMDITETLVAIWENAIC